MMTDRNENMRKLLEVALECGRKHKSSQTGFLHHCYHLQEAGAHQTIPLVENFLYALALFRSRIAENVNEGKELLDRLLHFQNRQQGETASGNFPIYLHEFPICKDRFLGVHIAAAVYWILKFFHQVLGQDLKKRLEESLQLVISHLLDACQEKTPPYPLAVKIASVMKSSGDLLQLSHFQDAGEKLLKELNTNPDLFSWHCASAMGTMLEGLTMVYPRLSESIWKNFWKHLEDTWHRRTCTYVGPSLKEWQKGLEPEVTSYDLFLGYFSGAFADRVFKEELAPLTAALIPPTEDVFHSPSYPLSCEGEIEGARWSMYHAENLAYSIVEAGSLNLNPVYERGFHPLRIVWGDRQRTHTFVCQGKNHKAATFDILPGGIAISFELKESVDEEDREKSRELAFFIDNSEEVEFLVAGHKASTFLLGEPISLKSGGCKLQLRFDLEEGEGRFLGHRMLGNRPSQISLKGPDRYNAYDWQIFLRTIRRSERCVAKVILQIMDTA